MDLMSIRASLMCLTAYRPLLDTPVMEQVMSLLKAIQKEKGEEALEAYTELFYTLRTAGSASIGDWLWERLRFDESPYARLAEQGANDPILEQAARRDVEVLSALAGLDGEAFPEAIAQLLKDDLAECARSLPRLDSVVPFTFDTLTSFYQENGAGLFAHYRAFLWEDGKLIPVADPDCPKPEDLLGYELQRDQVEANTRKMFSGHQANNVLLFGDGGTGKSATVKSMLYLPGMEDLRLIEIEKENITGLPSLIRSLNGKRHKFILFIDDLAFDQDDNTYSSMKTILEGSLEKRPVNVAIYATSNRRHLVRQTFTDRAGDEVDTFETISEKTALAERFGLRIPYLTMNKVSYLALVEHLAKQAGIEMEKSELHARAMTWEIRHSGRTPRVARQFIASLHT